MKVRAVRDVIKTSIQEFERIKDTESLQLSNKLLKIFEESDAEDPISSEQGTQAICIIESFWKDLSQKPMTENWHNNATVSTWLTLQEKLKELNWSIQTAHHLYFYPCLLAQYNQSGNDELSGEKLMPLLIEFCRMLKYANQNEVQDYPFSYLTAGIAALKVSHKSHLADGFKTIATYFAVLFYLFYHRCSPAQLEIMPLLIKYRIGTTDEEVRSETATFNALIKNPLETLKMLHSMAPHIDGRELNIRTPLITLKGLIPNSRRVLIKSTVQQGWYYGITGCFRDNDSKTLINSLHLAVETSFSLDEDTSYTAALLLAEKISQFFSHLPTESKNDLLSALYSFCLGQYIKLCNSNPNPSRYLWFTPETKTSAAKKLQQQEQGMQTHLGLREWAATREGRLKELVTRFEEYKKGAVLIDLPGIKI